MEFDRSVHLTQLKSLPIITAHLLNAMPPALVLRHCRVLEGEDAAYDGRPHDIVIRGRVIEAVLPDGQGPADEPGLDARGLLAAPGLINGHLHSHEHFQKGRFPNLPLEVWMNYVRPPRGVPYTERQVYLRTMLGIVEALRSGATTIVDDLSIGAVPNRRYLQAAQQAYEDAGIRAVVGVSMLDRPFFESVPFIEDECPPELLAQLRQQQRPDADALLAVCRELARTRHPRERRVGFIVSPSAPQRCSEAFLCAARALADEFELPLMTHVQETRLQAVTAQQRYGTTMVEYLDRIGFLKPATTLIHGVWLTPREIDILARRGVTVQHNPWSNLRLGSGLAPLRALLDAGVNVSLGSDGCSSTDTMNMLNVVGCASVLHTLRGRDPSRWPGARDAWRAGTVGGARALGLDSQLGGIAAGKWADLVLYRTDSVHLMPLNDPLQQLSHAERGSGIHTVIVDGEVVLADGHLTRLDEAAFAAELIDGYEALREQIDQAEASARPLHPIMQRIHERCLREQVAAGVIPARFEP